MTTTETPRGDHLLGGHRVAGDRVDGDRLVGDRSIDDWSGETAPLSRPGSGSTGRGHADWEPLAGPALVDRLRVTGLARPRADPEMVADLRTYLERGLADVVPAAGGPALVVTRHRIARALACPVHRDTPGRGPRVTTLPLACGALVAVLFRQLVATGAIGAAWDEALEGLGLDDHQAPLAGWIGDLPGPARSELRAEVERQADGLRRRWPPLDPMWLPRTQESLRVPLAGGRCLVSARVDLVLGRPAEDVATVALIEVTSGARWPGHAADRRFDALVETLRSGIPPFAVATYSARTGELDVDPVTPELLADAARRCLAGARAMATEGAGLTATTDDRHCTACASSLLPVRPALVELPAPSPPAPGLPAVAPVVDRARSAVGVAGGLPAERAA
jgi:hypothetical protein